MHRNYFSGSCIFLLQEEQNKKQIVNYLTFGTSRRTMEYSSYGNDPVIVRRPVGPLVVHDSGNISSQILRIYRKPRDSCIIN